MTPIQLHLTAAKGPKELLLQFQWGEITDPTTTPQPQQRGLLSLTDGADGVARAVWFSTMRQDVLLPSEVVPDTPTESELLAAEERVSIAFMRDAINPSNYKRLAQVYLAWHRHARSLPTAFEAICTAAREEINDYSEERTSA